MPIGFDLNTCLSLCEKHIVSEDIIDACIQEDIVDACIHPLCNLSLSGILPPRECINLFRVVLNSEEVR